MLKRLITAAIVLIVALAVAVPVMAINFGEPDNGEHPYVGLMYWPAEGGGGYVCSGTLISPTVFLTAGHCAGPASLATEVRVSFAEMGPYGGTWHYGTAYAHPLFDDFAGFPAIYDVGVVVFAEPIAGITPARVAPLGYLDSYERELGLQDTIFVPVGYGVNSYKPVYEWYFARYKGEQRIINLVNANTDGYNVMLTNNPGKGNGVGGTCSGDSGGPILHQGDMVVAINSFGIAPYCKGNDYAYRADIQPTYDFLCEFVDLEGCD